MHPLSRNLFCYLLILYAGSKGRSEAHRPTGLEAPKSRPESIKRTCLESKVIQVVKPTEAAVVQRVKRHNPKTMSPVQRNRSGKFVGSEQRKLIVNLYKAIATQSRLDNAASKTALVNQVAEELGFGLKMVFNTVNEYFIAKLEKGAPEYNME